MKGESTNLFHAQLVRNGQYVVLHHNRIPQKDFKEETPNGSLMKSRIKLYSTRYRKLLIRGILRNKPVHPPLA